MKLKRKRKKRGITIKIPCSQLDRDSLVDKVKEYLKKGKEKAYTIMGLMVESSLELTKKN